RRCVSAPHPMIPKTWCRLRILIVGLLTANFWLAPIGTVLYIASMWVNGITRGLLWRAVNEDGTLNYSFVEALVASHPGYVVRLLGGATFASGMLLMAYNTWRTLRSAQDQRQPVLAAGQGA
ncbi:cytochrome C oxidase Cbb3, partial [Pseudomonas aeruginosa]